MPNDPAAILPILVIIALISVVKNISDMIHSWRKNPSIDKEMQDYMPRNEIQGCFNDLKEEDTKIWQRLNGMDRTNTRNQGDIQRSLGRLEGKIDKLREKS
ncbi:hypothetical protein P0Y35_08600 [Kiritimatiellaeota bacterium B1221]|nr:hypothetical protein [Kiritimatiellaeota bacterium B1221]